MFAIRVALPVTSRQAWTCFACVTKNDSALFANSKFLESESLKYARYASTSTSASTRSFKNGGQATDQSVTRKQLPPHSLLPTKILLRSLLVTTILSKPYLVKPALSFMLLLTKKPSVLLDVNKNALLYAILKRTFYNHFCAGENQAEVTSTIRSIKDIGFKGVVLTYAREIVVDERSKQERGLGMQEVERDETDSELADKEKFADIETWRSGVLETLDMADDGDFLALKFTGAGPTVTEALRSNQPLPEPMQDALESICGRALRRNVRILVDAEQQSVQPAIDAIALQLMSKYNRATTAILYNTYQMYLKSSIGTLNRHMRQAARHGYTLGVKIVRGAYMNSEPRELIRDSKNDTDVAYDRSVKAMIHARYVTDDSEKTSQNCDTKAPPIDLFIASHNANSALSALQWHQERLTHGLPTINKIQYGQLLGMADEVSCGLLQKGQETQADTKDDTKSVRGPDVYKCLSWGTLEDCMSYLVRRAVENKDAVTRTQSEQIATKTELWRRSKAFFGLTA